MFGAIGNGISDDTIAIKDSIRSSQQSGIPLFLPSGYTFLVTAPLNDVADEIVLNIKGCNFAGMYRYGQDKCGCIQLSNGTKMFSGATVSGNISNIYVCGVRNESVHIFDNCELSSLNIINCHFVNVGAFLYDSSLKNLCRIIGNTFLTCYWFARSSNKENWMVDSTIADNYINGGEELNNNNCFEFAYYNGSSIQNNFIDYYRTIYHPKAPQACGFVGPMSKGNQYQMFKYFYYFEENAFANSTCSFTSVSDAFNHTDSDALDYQDQAAAAKLFSYETLKYHRQDTADRADYDLPSCIGYTKETAIINISDAKIESNIGTVLFVMDSITNYEYARFKLHTVCENIFSTNNVQVDTNNLVYNGGNYRHINKIDTNMIKNVSSLPVITEGWVNGLSAFGMKVLYNNRILTASMYYSQNAWHCGWLDEYGNIVQ